MKKILVIFVCFTLTACYQTYNPNRTDIAGLQKNDEFMNKVRGNQYVSNDKTIALIALLKNSYGDMISDGEIKNFEPNGHGLGYSKHYSRMDGIFATVFSFHARVPADQMPVNVRVPDFSNIYKLNVDDLKSSEGKWYKNIKILKDDFVTVQGAEQAAAIEFKEFKYSAYDMRAGQDVISVMYMTIHNGAILKVRINYPVTAKTIGQNSQDMFMKDLVNGLAD